MNDEIMREKEEWRREEERIARREMNADIRIDTWFDRREQRNKRKKDRKAQLHRMKGGRP